MIKTITDLERIGDEAEKIARMAVRLAAEERPKNNYAEIQSLGNHVRQMLHDALDAFAHVDIEAAVRVAREDRKIDQKYEGVIRQMITFKRISCRVPKLVRKTLEKAAALLGVTLSQFVVQAALKKAHAVLELELELERERFIRLSRRDAEVPQSPEKSALLQCPVEESGRRL